MDAKLKQSSKGSLPAPKKYTGNESTRRMAATRDAKHYGCYGKEKKIVISGRSCLGSAEELKASNGATNPVCMGNATGCYTELVTNPTDSA